MKVLVPVSLGELWDKISILRIKDNRITDEKKLENIHNELNQLLHIADEHPQVDIKFYYDLFNVNDKLWDVEDQLREQESQELFDDVFIDLARQVYHLNDERARIKREINEKYGSDIIEEKSYKEYK